MAENNINIGGGIVSPNVNIGGVQSLAPSDDVKKEAKFWMDEWTECNKLRFQYKTGLLEIDDMIATYITSDPVMATIHDLITDALNR